MDNLDKIHTTELGEARIRNNLGLEVDNIVDWCREKIGSGHAIFTRRGKNWYVGVDGCIITINAYSYTIITAHKQRSV